MIVERVTMGHPTFVGDLFEWIPMIFGMISNDSLGKLGKIDAAYVDLPGAHENWQNKKDRMGI